MGSDFNKFPVHVYIKLFLTSMYLIKKIKHVTTCVFMGNGVYGSSCKGEL